MNLLQKAACLFILVPALAVAGGHKHDEAKENIVSIAAGNDAFTTLVTALKAADLVSALQGEGPFTVFAPTNEAFSKVPKDVLENLLKPENKAQLQAVLTYHVVAGKVDAATASSLTGAKTLQGEQISISVKGQKVMINQAQVVKADIMASNGVIHVIDTVILPPTVVSALESNKRKKWETEKDSSQDYLSVWESNIRKIYLAM